MYLVAFALAFIILVAVVVAYPFQTNPSRQNPHYHESDHDRPLDGDNGELKPEEFDNSRLKTRTAFPSVVPEIDVTQPLLHPQQPLETQKTRPAIPHGSTDPVDILEHPTLLVEDPPRSHINSFHPVSAIGNPVENPFGNKEVTVKLPRLGKLCSQIGIDRPATFHLKGNASIHGTNLVQAAVDPDGQVIPHIYITAWDRHTGEVTLRNDTTNWRGDIVLGYYQECNRPEDFEDEWNVVKYGKLPIAI